MKEIQNSCESYSRRRLFLASMNNQPNENVPIINGIDYIEIKNVNNPLGLENGSSSETSRSNQTETSNTLLLLFLFNEPSEHEITKDNVIIIGGTRIQNIEVRLAGRLQDIFEDLNDSEKEAISDIEYLRRKKLVVVKPTISGDFSRYLLKIVKKENPDEPLPSYDPLLSQIEFSFDVECDASFDCKVDVLCPPVSFKEPSLDYMAKDYASFNELILSRFSHILPKWKEKSAADLTNVLIEILAYVGDHLSYYQDAVATETYLGTARNRVSVKRHARLLDYFINEGSNARAWICFEVSSTTMLAELVKGIHLTRSTKIITGDTRGDRIPVSEETFKEIARHPGIAVFETMHDIYLYQAHNEMHFYTWGESGCCLPRGSTQATLMREWEKTNQDGEIEILSLDIKIFNWEETIEGDPVGQQNLKEFIMKVSPLFQHMDSLIIEKVNESKLKLVDIRNPLKFILIELSISKDYATARDIQNNVVYEFMTKVVDNQTTEIYGLSLIPGDVVIFEEILSPTTLHSADRDPLHRQAVKLRNIKRRTDPIKNVKLIEIYWDHQDVLQFPLCLNVPQTGQDNSIIPISIVRGNVVLADHGNTIINEELEIVPSSGIYYPKLDKFPITFGSPYLQFASANFSINHNQGIDNISTPSIFLTTEVDSKIRWLPSSDLLSSDKFAKQFVVEIDNEGVAHLRFGDGINGQKPNNKFYHPVGNSRNNDSTRFFATYRVGNGTSGNVGYDTIKRIVKDKNNIAFIDKIINVRNPIPAVGGANQETLDEVRQNAPIAFMRQERAVTEEDYKIILARHPEIQNAVAIFRWTGSWYTVFVTIDRLGGKTVDECFKQEIQSFLNKFRLAGYDLEINSPNFVPVDIQVEVCVKSNHFPHKVKSKLQHTFSTLTLEDGKNGVFHPNNFTFGQPLYLSKIYQIIMNTEGVESAYVTKFKRMGKANNSELEKGIIETHGTEIIQANNDPNYPDNGRIEFVMRGGA